MYIENWRYQMEEIKISLAWQMCPFLLLLAPVFGNYYCYKKQLQKYFHRPNCVSCGVQFWGPARKRREKSRCCLSQWFQMTKNSPKIRLQNSWNCLIILVQASFWWIMRVKGIQSPETEIMGLNQLQVGWKIVKSSELIFGGF